MAISGYGEENTALEIHHHLSITLMPEEALFCYQKSVVLHVDFFQ